MLTNEQTIDLLTAVSAYDGRKANRATVMAWREAGERARWTFPEALDAIHEYFTESSEWIMPAHITTRIRTARNDRAMREQAAIEAAPDAAGVERVHAMVAAISARVGMPTDDEADAARREVRCPWCGSQPGERCVNHATGKPLKRTACHDGRREAYRAAIS